MFLVKKALWIWWEPLCGLSCIVSKIAHITACIGSTGILQGGQIFSLPHFFKKLKKKNHLAMLQGM